MAKVEKITLGVRREDKNRWERRVPLTPHQVNELLTLQGIGSVVQPSDIRIFSDEQYLQAGSLVQEDLSSCSVVFGVKEMPSSLFRENTAYAFFSHTIKGQSHNMPMLKHLMDMKCHLIDYERVVDAQGKRLLFFGRYAGLAGMLDSLWALGRRMEWKGVPTPFSSLKQTYCYPTLKEAKEAVAQIGEVIRSQGLPDALVPLVCGFTGYGHVSKGAQEMFDLLPFREIAPEALRNGIQATKESRFCLYKSVFEEKHLVKSLRPGNLFGLQEYYDHPENYQSQFSDYLPMLTMLINAIYWTPKYPRFVTRQSLLELFESGPNPRLQVIGDITCDIQGAIECTLHTTEPDQPVFVYHPGTDQTVLGYQGDGVVVLAVDNLPCELPRASSIHFGQTLMPYLPAIARANFLKDLDDLDLPAEIKKSIIVHRGKLTPSYHYLSEYLEAAKEEHP